MSGDAIYAQVQRRLLETGEWDRLLNIVKTKLNDNGAYDTLLFQAKERSAHSQAPILRTILQGVQDDARGDIPASVRNELLDIISRSIAEQLA